MTEAGLRISSAELCAHCGAPLEEANVVQCGDCHFVYCVDHSDGEAHLCAVVCEDCASAEEADAGALDDADELESATA